MQGFLNYGCVSVILIIMKINWFILSLLALLSYSFMSFLIVFLTRKGYPTSFVLLGLSIVLVIFFAYQTFVISHYKVVFNWVMLLIILIGILSAVANLWAYQAASDAPNPGLALSITGMQAVGVSILAFIFFRDRLTTLQIIGVIFSIAAIFLISIGSNKSDSNKLSNNPSYHKSSK